MNAHLTQRHMRCLVVRQERLLITQAVLVLATVVDDKIKDATELAEHLRSGVTKWAKETAEGKALYEYAGSDMNIGDLSNCETHELQAIVERCPCIVELDIQDLAFSSTFHYDTCLCDDLSDE